MKTALMPRQGRKSARRTESSMFGFVYFLGLELDQKGKEFLMINVAVVVGREGLKGKKRGSDRDTASCRIIRGGEKNTETLLRGFGRL